jgi:hypothetical protein
LLAGFSLGMQIAACIRRVSDEKNCYSLWLF